jgi:hypothetical protein
MFAERLQNLMKAIHAGQLDHLRSAAMESAKELDYRFRESCHKRGIHLSFQALYVRGH